MGELAPLSRPYATNIQGVNIMITKDTIISDIPQLNPAALDVLWNYGMGCIHCVLANSETIEQAAAEHGLDVEQLIKELNEAKEEK